MEVNGTNHTCTFHRDYVMRDTSQISASQAFVAFFFCPIVLLDNILIPFEAVLKLQFRPSTRLEKRRKALECFPQKP